MSASVKIDSPEARAVKPPSAASSILRMISFVRSGPDGLEVSAIGAPGQEALSN